MPFGGCRRLVLLITVLLAVLGMGLLSAPDRAEAATQVDLTGHGYGHGRGMGQWGSYGYAVDGGWSWQQILDHYYGGTRLHDQGPRDYSVRITGLDGADKLTFTSAAPYWVGGIYVGAGSGSVMERTSTGWRLWTQHNGCAGNGVRYGPWDLPAWTLLVPAVAPNKLTDLLTVCNTGVHYRGSFGLPLEGGSTRVVNILPMEDYLLGVVPRESPASWGDAGGGRGMNALYAQSVAARSYASAEARYSYAWTCDTTSCQVYSGAGASGVWREDYRTTAAVQGTAGMVRLMPNNAVARTEFSSSTGGYSAGGTFPAVPDAGDSASPYHDWRVTLSGSELSRRYSIGEFVRIHVTARNGLGAEGGRVLSMQIIGSASTATRTGDQFREEWGLRSNWFTPVEPINTLWLLRNPPSPGAAEAVFNFGSAYDTALACDVNGDRRDDIVVYRDGLWTFRFQVNPGPADLSVSYGNGSMRPVCGDWDGDGVDGIGVYDQQGNFWLRNTASPGAPDAYFQFGWGAAVPVTGRFGGSADGIGIYDPLTGRWYLRQTASPGNADIQFAFGGWTGTIPVIGDWNGDGMDGIGVFSAGGWYLRNTPSPGSTDLRFDYGGNGYLPVVGNWDGAGGDGIGVVRPD
jgi:SpoIID/LytB domain protein